MTSPVIEKSSLSESIAMTSPVIATIEGESHTIAFGMPRSYTLETLPTPNDNRIQIVTIPEKKMAVIRFSWLRTNSRVESKKKELLELLKKRYTKDCRRSAVRRVQCTLDSTMDDS